MCSLNKIKKFDSCHQNFPDKNMPPPFENRKYFLNGYFNLSLTWLEKKIINPSLSTPTSSLSFLSHKQEGKKCHHILYKAILVIDTNVSSWSELHHCCQGYWTLLEPLSSSFAWVFQSNMNHRWIHSPLTLPQTALKFSPLTFCMVWISQVDNEAWQVTELQRVRELNPKVFMNYEEAMENRFSPFSPSRDASKVCFLLANPREITVHTQHT